MATLLLMMLASVSISAAFGDAEICTYGLDQDHDLRRWIVKGANYGPFICAQTMLDDIRMPVKIPPKEDWRHPPLKIIDNRPKPPEALRPSLLDTVGTMLAKALKQELLEDGYTIIKDPAPRSIEVALNHSSQLEAAMKEATCHEYASRVIALCATVAELRPTAAVEAFYHPKSAKKPVKPAPVVVRKKKALPKLVPPPAPDNSGSDTDTTPAPRPAGKQPAN